MNRGRLLILSLSLCVAAGCARPPREARTPVEAEQKLIRLAKEEFNLDIVTKAFDHTLWIYLPLDQPFIFMTSTAAGPMKSSLGQDKPVIRYLDGNFENGNIQLTYDFGTQRLYPDDKGIQTKYTDEFASKQQFLINAIYRAYGDIERKPGSDRYAQPVEGDVSFANVKRNASHKELVHAYVKTDLAPDFVVIVVADIKNGMESRVYLHVPDVLRAHYDPGFSEEYVKRLVYDQMIGHDAIIGDKTGAHLDAHDLTWGEFLAKQIVYRINFKYQRSAYPPSDDTRAEILTIAADTLAGYDFTDFTSLELNDLDTGVRLNFSPQELAQYRSTPSSSEGRLIHIQFK